MRNENTQLVSLIKEKALELLMQKNPEEIRMSDIAASCGITPTTIYHYYKDKDRVFQAVSLDCLRALNSLILERAEKARSIKSQVKNAITAFRDWCFENPRCAMLIMQGIKSADDLPPESAEEFYVCNRTGERLLRKAVAHGEARSKNIRLDVGILVSGLWGCIESVLLKKSEVQYWENGAEYTDRFIALWLDSIFIEDGR